jgi:GR25 family glycosyltransferase involved in LPS biosynthesis
MFIILFIFIIFIIFYLKNYSYFEYFSNDPININHFIESIYIITIPNRLNYVTDFSKSFNLNSTIFNALLKSQFNNYNNIYNLKIGEIACASSHIRVLEIFIKSKNNNILIFEDDVMHYTNNNYKFVLDKIKEIEEYDIIEYIYNAYKSLPKDWDLLYLGRCWDDCQNHKKINKYLIKTNRALCNHAIIYSRKGAKIILDNISHPLQMPIDHIIANLSLSNNLNCYGTIIPIFYQNRNELSSSVGNYDHLPVCL